MVLNCNFNLMAYKILPDDYSQVTAIKISMRIIDPGCRPQKNVHYLLGKTCGQIDDGHIGNWDAEGHSSQLAVERWNDLADGLGSTRRRRDDVGGRRATAAPVLGRWAVDRLLGGRVGVHGGHQCLDDLEVVVNDLGERRQAVGRARGIATVTI
jgi:hypothetical protein